MLYIGVDPGVSGGIAMVDNLGHFLEAHKMPDTETDLLDLLRRMGAPLYRSAGAPHARAMLERANAGVFGGERRMGVTSAFTFGKNYGALRIALIAAGIPFDVVSSQQWQKLMACRSGGEKNITKARAQQLFPGVKVTHAIADALLLAEFCRRAERGSLNREPATKGLFDGEKEGSTEEGIATRRRARAAHRADPPAPASGAVARRRGRSRLEEDRRGCV